MANTDDDDAMATANGEPTAVVEDGELMEDATTEVATGNSSDQELLTWFAYDARQPITRLLRATEEFASATQSGGGGARPFNNFTKGVKVSPDGLCILTNSEDHILRLFELPEEDNKTIEQKSILQASEGGSIYDFAWYPFMTSQNAASCIFISTSRDHPIHMWDAFTGDLRATYRAYDHLDEISAANSVVFNATGDKIFAGYDRMIRFFDITQPGREFVARPLCKTRKSRQGQRGIVSTLHFNPDYSGIYAAGSYNGTTCIYTEDTGEEVLRVKDHGGHGITQVQFSPDGKYLFTAARRDDDIHCWDIRHTRQIVHTFERHAETNQRIEFDVHCSGKYLATGSRDGRALLYDVATGKQLANDQEEDQGGLVFPDAVNGVSFFPDGTRAKVALTTGQRHYDLPQDMEDQDEGEGGEETTTPPQEAKKKNALHVLEFGRI